MKTHVLLAVVLAALVLPGAVVAGTIYVDCNSPNDPGTGTQSDPYRHIQDGITNANPGDTVQVADGTYTGPLNKELDFGGKAITVQSENGPDVTIIDCEHSGRGFIFQTGETAASVVDGFTITNGSGSEGGGIFCRLSSSPTITNCIITHNTPWGHGGGIACLGPSNPAIINCTISDNTASAFGGGIWCYYYADATITNCTITGNEATSGIGGGICCHESSPTITNCTITGNEATSGHGGGISCLISASPTITNCTIHGNTATDDGGGISCLISASPGITNCTISGNEAGVCGGAISCKAGSSPTMTNCILWTNAAPNGHEIALMSTGFPSTLTVRYSDVQGGAGEAYVEAGCTLDLDASNIDLDPLFVSGPLHDYYLSQIAAGQGSDSPCVDAGSDPAANLGLDDRTTRTDGIRDLGIVDMGYHAPYALRIDSITRSGNDVTIHWNAQPGLKYVVESTENLLGDWTQEASSVSGPTWTDPGVLSGASTRKYYRVREADSVPLPASAPIPGRSGDADASGPGQRPEPCGSSRGNVRYGVGNVRRK